jgi:putative transposase
LINCLAVNSITNHSFLMTHTYSKTFYHLVWSTKNRMPFIDANIKDPLYRFFNRVFENRKCKLHIINGMPDHVHLLVSLPLTITIPQVVQQAKVSSTKWIRKEFPGMQQFAWQEGMGAFTVGYSTFDNVKNYIANQEKHHQKKTFDEEYLEFLKKFNIPYDKRFVLG